MKRSLFLFGFLTDSDVEWLVSTGEKHVFASGDNLVTQGGVTEWLYILLEGKAEVVTNEKISTLVSAGDIVGEISLFDSRPASATLRAAERTIALGINFQTLRERLGADPEFSSRVYFSLGTLLAQRMREMLGTEGDDADDIDPEVIEKVALAGHRFELVRERTETMSA